jgi:hypothetical protein
MPTEELVAAFIKGESLPVEVKAIEKELAALWRAAAESKDEAIRAVTRDCQLNLLIYSPNEGAYERAAMALPEIMRRHPSRVIALLAEPEAENEELAAYISSPPISNESRGEQITIVAKGNAVKNLAEITHPLRIADAPLALWWLGDLPEEDPLFEQLLAASHRLIFDSAFCRDVGNELSRARALSLGKAAFAVTSIGCAWPAATSWWRSFWIHRKPRPCSAMLKKSVLTWWRRLKAMRISPSLFFCSAGSPAA